MKMETATNFLITFSFAAYEIYAKSVFLLAKIFPKTVEKIVKFVLMIYGITVVNRTSNDNKEGQVTVVKPEQFYPRVLAYFDLGIFESYIDGDWETKDICKTLVPILKTRRFKYFLHPLRFLIARMNMQTKTRSWEVGRLHYDIGNELFEAMLGKHMQYSCAYWRNVSNLDEAQLAKMDLIAHKLKLQPGMRVLDMGCGFGALACHLAKNYGVSVVGCTVSEEQAKYAKALSEGLEVDIRLCDYRDINDTFDRVLSVGFFEHIGARNYRSHMQFVNKSLTDDGLFLLHTIGNNHSSVPPITIAVDRYIFPNGLIPSYLEIAEAIKDVFVIEDWHNFSFDYSKTVAAWEGNFENAWPKLKDKYGEKFYRQWKAYLNVGRALFVSRSFQLWQIVMSKDGLEGGYVSVR